MGEFLYSIKKRVELLPHLLEHLMFVVFWLYICPDIVSTASCHSYQSCSSCPSCHHTSSSSLLSFLGRLLFHRLVCLQSGFEAQPDQVLSLSLCPVLSLLSFAHWELDLRAS